MTVPTEEVDVQCPRCQHKFVVEVEAADPTPNPDESGADMRHYKLAEVAEMFSVGRSTLKRWIYSGKIKAVKFGGDEGGAPWRISEAELKRFRAQRGR